MLKELRIKNLAIISDLSVGFSRGLNVLTGETGAGKSIIVDALGLALGDRAQSDMIRAGTFTTWTESSAHGVSAPRDGHLILFPIPAPQIASNPQLSQNPGY